MAFRDEKGVTDVRLADKFGDNEKYTEYVFERILKPYEREALAVTLRQLLDE